MGWEAFGGFVICMSFNKMTLAVGWKQEGKSRERKPVQYSLQAQAGDAGGLEQRAFMEAVRVGFQM